MKKDYFVLVNAWNGSFYLTEGLEFKDSLGDDVIWSGETWDKKTIENYIKDDAKNYDYSYKVEVLPNE